MRRFLASGFSLAGTVAPLLAVLAREVEAELSLDLLGPTLA